MLQLDPALFRSEAVAVEQRELLAQLDQQLKSVTPNYLRTPDEVRAEREAGTGIFPAPVLVEQARVRTTAGPAGELPLRLFIPDRVEGVYLHIHGGGWVTGRAHHQDPRLWALATSCNLAVVSVDYRLAPEDRYPAAPDDCEAAAAWLVESGRAEFGTDRFVIGGESAGGHLAAVTLLRMRDRHGYRGFRAANLVFGVFDLSMTPSCMQWGERELVLSRPTMQWFIDHFTHPGQRRDPDVSPLYADLAGLPPALFTVGTLDPLLDDTLFMAQRWLAAGNETQVAVYPGATHGFNRYPTAQAADANALMDRFLTEHVQNAD